MTIPRATSRDYRELMTEFCGECPGEILQAIIHDSAVDIGLHNTSIKLYDRAMEEAKVIKATRTFRELYSFRINPVQEYLTHIKIAHGYIFSASDDGSFRVFNMEGTRVCNLDHKGGVWAYDVYLKDRTMFVVSGSLDRVIKISQFDTVSTELLHTAQMTYHKGTIRSIIKINRPCGFYNSIKDTYETFPDANKSVKIYKKALFASGGRDNTICLFDETCSMICCLTGHEESIRTLESFSTTAVNKYPRYYPDGDQTNSPIDIPGESQRSMDYPPPYKSSTVTGSFIVSGSYDGTVRLWDISTIEEDVKNISHPNGEIPGFPCTAIIHDHNDRVYGVGCYAGDGYVLIVSGGIPNIVYVSKISFTDTIKKSDIEKKETYEFMIYGGQVVPWVFAFGRFIVAVGINGHVVKYDTVEKEIVDKQTMYSVIVKDCLMHHGIIYIGTTMGLKVLEISSFTIIARWLDGIYILKISAEGSNILLGYYDISNQIRMMVLSTEKQEFLEGESERDVKKVKENS